MEEQVTATSKLWLGIGGTAKAPQVVHVRSIGQLQTPGTPQQVKCDPGEGLQQRWEAQWQEFLRTLQAPGSEWGNTPLSEEPPLWEDAKVFLASFEQVASACRWPRDKWVTFLLPALSGEAKQAFSSLSSQDREDYGKVKMAILQREANVRERQRQHFRQFCYQEMEGPRAVYGRLQQLCCQWLKTERHSKEEILELLILEQFLTILPQEMQSWVREHGPESCMQAVALAEDFLSKQQEEVEKQEQKERGLAADVFEGLKTPQYVTETAVADNAPLDGNVAGGELFYGKLLVVQTLHDARQIFTDFHGSSHGGHRGIVKTRMAIKQRYYWPGMTRDIEAWVPVPFVEAAAESSEAGQVLLLDAWTHREAKQEYNEGVTLQGNGLEWENEKVCLHREDLEQAELHMASLGRDENGQNSKKGMTVRAQGNQCEKNADDSIFCTKGGKEDKVQQMVSYSEVKNASSDNGRNFGQSSDLTKHENVHAGEKPHISYCGNSFDHTQNHIMHERTHPGDNNLHKCAHCGKSFSRGSSFKEHLRTHAGEALYRCCYCGKNFDQGSIFREHVKTHTGERPYRCTDCGRSFNRKCYLTIHERMHRGENPYTCVHCGKSFPKGSKLVIHERIHTGENPYICSECGKSFNQKGNLVTHMRIHTGEKPYKCTHCGKRFSQKSGLSSHEKTHMGIKRTV
ncbi:zinc finger protein with KRAB and SCAN domains 4-like [Eublepharis macularius]|uniref:Zinc finger protein with KRAB and SCAN domains 4-like n=1 Tax=Eublepharis macularius TaxID=481883 RepID=A0AA97J6W4_EUBMA|nr:zinc finger protein with KRAB and SCAN domains 4-like [Eublepharis macularius]